MKKLCVLLVALMVALTGTAFAGGLGGLGGGTSGGGLIGLTGTTTLLPDPCLVFADDDHDMVGKLYQADYQFSADYLCDAYVYPYLGRSFVAEYTILLKDFGYTITETKVDGVNGYSIQRGDGLEALLVLNFDGQTLFLVEKGMDFVLTNVMSCVYNGSQTEGYLWSKSTPSKYVLSNSWGMSFQGVNAKFDKLDFDVPDYAQAGDAYEILSTRDAYEDLKLTMWPKTGNPVTLLHDDITFRRPDKIKTADDFYILEVTRLEETKAGTLLVGTFEGSFDGGKYKFEDGHFSAMINDR